MVDIWCVWLDRSSAVLFIIFVIVDIDLLIFQVLVSEVTDEAKIYACNVNDGPALEKLMDCLREEFTANPPVSYHAIMFFFIFKIVSILYRNKLWRFYTSLKRHVSPKCPSGFK